MPCDASHCEPHRWEIEASRAYCIFDEVNGGPPPSERTDNAWKGYHPKAYNMHDRSVLDRITKDLCEVFSGLGDKDVAARFSLETQMWWRDHKAADAARKNPWIKYPKIKVELVDIKGFKKATEIEGLKPPPRTLKIPAGLPAKAKYYKPYEPLPDPENPEPLVAFLDFTLESSDHEKGTAVYYETV